MICFQKKAAEKKELESSKTVEVQVDDLLTFRQFSKKASDDLVDVSNSSICLVSPSLTTDSRRTPPTSGVLLALVKSKKTSSPTSAVYRSLLVSLGFRQLSPIL